MAGLSKNRQNLEWLVFNRINGAGGRGMKKPKNTVKWEIENTPEHEYLIKCHVNAEAVQLDIYNALMLIRKRIKYEEPSEEEMAMLEKIREILILNYVEG